MQQQMPQQEQCGSQQLPQQVMLCPVQYVYETPMMLPQVQQTQGDQIQQNQINQVLINVKNPPPWIQNRPQNQVVYVQQLPNQYQPYIQQQMIQNPIYQQQMTYQIHPMLQDNRQFIQIPNLNQFNTVQNAPAQIQQVSEDDKMPVLTQMLNQRANNVRPVNVNNARPTNITSVANMVSTNNMVSANAIRPITQNQLVQTDVATNTKGRPRNPPPQMMTINPMQQRQFLTNQKQDIQMNLKPQAMPVRNDMPQNVRTEVPQHIRTKIPSSISVKTINRPLLPRQMIRPTDVMPSPQNVFYSPIMMSAPNTENTNRHVTNTTTQSQIQQTVKPNTAQEMIPRATNPMQLPITTSNVLPFIKTEIKSPVDANVNKQIVNTHVSVANNTINVNTVKNNEDFKKPMPDPVTRMNTESQTQTEEKLVRNTVFIQARGRVLNEKETPQSNTLKRTTDDRLKQENEADKANISNNNPNSILKPKKNEISKQCQKYVKIAPAEKVPEIKRMKANVPTPKVPVSIQTQQSRISNLQMGPNNNTKPFSLNMPILDDFANNSTPNLNTLKSEDSKPKETKAIEKEIKPKTLEEPVKPKVLINREENNQETKKVTKKSDKENIKKTSEEKTKQEDIKKKEEKIQLLTHVLEGYIIQESNVPFMIQKPILEKDIKKEKINNKGSKSAIKKEPKTEEEEEDNKGKKENKGHFPWKFLNSGLENEKEMAVIDKDDPFTNITETTVASWTADQLSFHLQKHHWTETAIKLLDEEIDGESLLLVNKDQLVAIGVCEEHAEKIAAFVGSNS